MNMTFIPASVELINCDFSFFSFVPLCFVYSAYFSWELYAQFSLPYFSISSEYKAIQLVLQSHYLHASLIWTNCGVELGFGK